MLPRKPGRREHTGYRFNVVGLASLVVIVSWALLALFAPLLAPHPVGKIIDTDYFGAISRNQLMGSDYLGRDMLSRVLVGARYTLGISLVATVIACGSGVALGISMAIRGGFADGVVSRVLDALNSIPSKLFGLVAVAAVGSSITGLTLTLALIYMPGTYRFARALALNINAMDYMVVARVRGERLPYLIRSEVLPNIAGPIFADFGLRFVFIVLLLSSLSFLGLGVQPPNADWGALVRENLGGLAFGAPAIIFPSIALASLTISVNLLIDNLPRRTRDLVNLK